MNWQEVCDTPELTNLPFKNELNQQGQIFMMPVKVYHSLFQGKIAGLLYANLQNGDVLVKCAIATDKRTKVADIAWSLPDTLKVIRDETECSVVPEICIEVLSPVNTE
jgi:Uma2 family endonuclease